MKKIGITLIFVILLVACASTPTATEGKDTDSTTVKDSLAVRIWKPTDQWIYRMYNYKNKGLYLLNYHYAKAIHYMSYPELTVKQLSLTESNGNELKVLASSFDGEKIYLISENNHVYIFDCATETLEDITPDSSLVFLGVDREVYTNDTAGYLYSDTGISDIRFEGITVHNGNVVVGEYDKVHRTHPEHNNDRYIPFSRIWSYDGTTWTPLDSGWVSSLPISGIHSYENMLFAISDNQFGNMKNWNGSEWELVAGTKFLENWDSDVPGIPGNAFSSLDEKIYMNSGVTPFRLNPVSREWEKLEDVVWWYNRKMTFAGGALRNSAVSFHPFKGFMLYSLYYFNEEDQTWYSILHEEANRDTTDAYGDNNLAYDNLSSRVAMANIGDTLFISVGDHYPTEHQDLSGIYMLDTKETAWYKKYFGEDD